MYFSTTLVNGEPLPVIIMDRNDARQILQGMEVVVVPQRQMKMRPFVLRMATYAEQDAIDKKVKPPGDPVKDTKKIWRPDKP